MGVCGGSVVLLRFSCTANPSQAQGLGARGKSSSPRVVLWWGEGVEEWEGVGDDRKEKKSEGEGKE